MKKLSIVFAFLFSSFSSFSQFTWTWLHGPSGIEASQPQYSIVGTKGVSAPGNLPVSRKYGTIWRDKAGFLWMFGGTTAKGSLNDLWKYDPVKNDWAWMGGDTVLNSTGVMGTVGVPSKLAYPAATSGKPGWVDKAGNFWLFTSAQLWKFNPLMLEWTLVRISTGNIITGTPGVPSPENDPATTFTDAATWTDTAGNLLFASGKVYDRNNYMRPNYVWGYNVYTNMWTLLSGMPRTSGWILSGMAAWTDISGKLWSFGGNAEGNSKYTLIFWNTNLISNTYGTPAFPFDVPRDAGFYGTKGVEGPTTRPPARMNAIGWSDGKGNQYVFGGQYDTIVRATDPPQCFNDIWRYNPANSRWTWIGGDNKPDQPGNYGTIGVPSPLNKPGARRGSQSWSDPATGRMWIFGGEGYMANGVSQLRDMLLFTPVADAALPVRFGSFNAMQKDQHVALTWTTLQEQNAAAFVVERSSDAQIYTSIGTVKATGTTSSVSDYSFNDYSPLTGNNFYRLKQLDADNHFIYSEVKLVAINSAWNKIDVLQNPMQSQLKLQFKLGREQTVNIELKNTTGQQILTKTISVPAGSSKFSIDVADVRAGVYYLHITGKGFTRATSVLKK